MQITIDVNENDLKTDEIIDKVKTEIIRQAAVTEVKAEMKKEFDRIQEQKEQDQEDPFKKKLAKYRGKA